MFSSLIADSRFHFKNIPNDVKSERHIDWKHDYSIAKRIVINHDQLRPKEKSPNTFE